MTNQRVKELITLKTIAETLNQSNDLKLMLETVIEKLLELTGLTAGWIFLVDGQMEHEFVADWNLPAALLHNEKYPMRCDTCWCLDRYRSGRLSNAVNILNCKRIENATEYQWGDTGGITHHATVPLYSGERQFGVLNVAAPEKNHFSDEELALLQAVAFQIGSTIERMRLYAAEQRRADLYERLGEFSSKLRLDTSAGHELSPLIDRVVTLIGVNFNWPFVAWIEPAGNDFVLRSVYNNHHTLSLHTHFPSTAIHWINSVAQDYRSIAVTSAEIAELTSLREMREGISSLSSGLVTPISLNGALVMGVLVIGYDKTCPAHSVDVEVLEALAEHIAITLESARLDEQRRELARLEERNRLARDLHDSVCQILFSLSMTAKGVESMLGGDNTKLVLSNVRDMQSLSQNALKEMRALIMQLRPAGLDAGLITALKVYGEKLDLQVITQLRGIGDVPRTVEEALWRIGQEALNNVCKHAGTFHAEVVLQLNASDVVLRISDNGRGIAKRSRSQSTHSLGLTTMRERAEAIGGRFTLMSVYKKGTTIEVVIPLPFQ